MISSIGILILFGCIIVLCILIGVLSIVLVYERNQNQRALEVNQPFRSQVYIPMNNTNRMFNQYEDVDFICISMSHRKASHFDVLSERLAQEDILVDWFKGINGKTLNMDDYNLSPRYRKFFENNNQQREAGKTTVDYRGHLGCTLSHLNILANMERMTVILEDDVEPVKGFRSLLQDKLAAVTKLDPNWEILLLGWCCNYNDHFYCKLNDTEPIHEGGIVKVHYYFGGWSYCVRSAAVAQRIVQDFFNPINWHIDLSLAEAARTGQLKVYACVPTIINHAGWLKISTYDFWQIGDSSRHRSDTNSTIPDNVE